MTQAQTRPGGDQPGGETPGGDAPGQGAPAGGAPAGGAPAGGAPGGETPAGRRPGNPYLEILRLPGALAFSATGFLARMPMSMFGLGTVLLIAALTGRYGLAGAVAAAGSLSYAVAAPQLARLTDRFGQSRVLRPQIAVFGLATVTFMVLAETQAPLAATMTAGAFAGATMPSMGPMVRARWSVLLAGTDRLHAAFSLESVADEVIFVVGPAVVTLLATDVYPAAGLAAAGLACVTGTLLFVAQRRTQPPPRPPQARQPRHDGRAGRTRRPPVPGLFTLVPVYLFLGAMFATVDLSTVAFTAEHGHLQLAGLVLGTYALGSAIGGLWYGSHAWRAPLERRFLLTLCMVAAGVATFWLQPGLASLFGVIVVAGLAIAPTLIAGYSLIERQAPPERRTEGMTWLSSAISVGVAAGSSVAGHIIDGHGARGGYLFAAACGAAAVTAALAGLHRLRLPADTAAGSPGAPAPAAAVPPPPATPPQAVPPLG